MIKAHNSAISLPDIKFDETEAAYRPLLAIWAIKLAICCGWYRKPHAQNCRQFYARMTF